MNIFISGRVYTQNGMMQAFVVDNGRFIYVGDNDGAMAYDGEVTDLRGRFVCAGFNDSHMHLLNFGYSLSCADLSACTDSIGHLIEGFRQWAAGRSLTPDQWLCGRGFNQDYFQDEQRLITRDDLDWVDDRRPVIAVRACGHMCVVNSRALKLLGLESPVAVDGGSMDTDSDGRLLGIFRENAMNLVYDRMPAFTLEDVKAMLLTAAGEVNRYGVTSVQSDDFLALPSVSYEMVTRAYETLAAEGRLTVRVNEQCQLGDAKHLREFLKVYDYTKYPGSGVRRADSTAPSRMFKQGPLKILGDGSLGARTAFMSEPYSDSPNNRGIEVYRYPVLWEMIAIAHDAGMPVCIHAIGDGMMDSVLKAYASVLDGGAADCEAPGAGAGHRCGVVHCQIMKPEHYEMFKKLNLHAYIQPIFLDYDIRIVEARVGRERASASYNFKRFNDLGVTMSCGSDCPVELPIPLRGIQCAVTRKSLDGIYGPYLPDQALTVKEALDAYTIAGAWASFEESIKGDIKSGMLADFVILDEDPLDYQREAEAGAKPINVSRTKNGTRLCGTNNAEDEMKLRAHGQIGNIRVLETWLGGRRVFCAH